MKKDIVIVGAGPVGLLCAYLGKMCGLDVMILDLSEGPLKKGRADALNARTLQLLETAGLLNLIYPFGKTCNTSSIWSNGGFVSRQSSWWEKLEGCFHKHFLMIGQSHVETVLDQKCSEVGTAVKRQTSVKNIELTETGCLTTLSTGEQIESRFVIGADGARSLVRQLFQIPFKIVRPEIIWAVIDGVIETDFPKVPEIIVFQAETADVAWIPREGKIDRFYVRMDTEHFTIEDALSKINRAMRPHTLTFKEIDWYSKFSVKESVAESFFVHDRIFLAGDACHIHSVNGGQGLNTGLADAFNLIWKLKSVLRSGASQTLLKSYESERKPIAESVIETSGKLVRSTKDSPQGTHAADYIKLVEKHSGNITGMGIRYEGEGLCGTRVFDFEIYKGPLKTRLYSLLSYAHYTLLIFGECETKFELPESIKVIRISFEDTVKDTVNDITENFWTKEAPYQNQAILIRPDSYIDSMYTLDQLKTHDFKKRRF